MSGIYCLIVGYRSCDLALRLWISFLPLEIVEFPIILIWNMVAVVRLGSWDKQLVPLV